MHIPPTFPVNILAITAFGSQLNDEDVTGTDTKLKKSHFYWKGDNKCNEDTTGIDTKWKIVDFIGRVATIVLFTTS